MHLVGDREGLLSAGWIEAHVATYCLFATNHQRQLAHRTYNFDHDGG